MMRAWHLQPEASYHTDEPRECIGKYPLLETSCPNRPPAEFTFVEGTLPVTVLVTSLARKGSHLWNRPKKKGQYIEFFMRNGADHLYILKIEIICLSPSCNTITPIIGPSHILLKVRVPIPGHKSDRWINMTHFNERTKNALLEWIHHSVEPQLWILVDPDDAKYHLDEAKLNGGCTTISEMYIITSWPNHDSHYEKKDLFERHHRRVLTS